MPTATAPGGIELAWGAAGDGPPVLITTQNFAQTTPWFPDSLAEPTQELLPGATVEAVENGHLSRPDITATAVREMTS